MTSDTKQDITRELEARFLAPNARWAARIGLQILYGSPELDRNTRAQAVTALFGLAHLFETHPEIDVTTMGEAAADFAHWLRLRTGDVAASV